MENLRIIVSKLSFCPMLAGHLASALALRAWGYAHVPFWQLALGAAFSDVIFVALGLAGIETFALNPAKAGFARLELVHAPYSHGLAWVLLTAAAFAACSRLARGARAFAPDARVGFALALVSHYACDYVVHSGTAAPPPRALLRAAARALLLGAAARADLHLGFSGPPIYGLGLWGCVAPPTSRLRLSRDWPAATALRGRCWRLRWSLVSRSRCGMTRRWRRSAGNLS